MACYKNSHYQMQYDQAKSSESMYRSTQHESQFSSHSCAMNSSSAQISSISSLAISWLSDILSLIVVGFIISILSIVRFVVLA